MNHRKWLSLLLVGAMLFGGCAGLLGCEPSAPIPPDTSANDSDTNPVTEDTTPVTEDTTPVTEDTTPVTEDTTPVTEDTTPVTEDTTPVTEDTTPVTEDTTPPADDPNKLDADQPKLATLTLDDGTELAFDPALAVYNVTLPAGRPRVPRIAATAADADAEVTIYQAVFPDGASESLARVDVKLGDTASSYIINFQKDASLGFHLQYDDRYTFTPAYTLEEGEAFTFETSNADVASVSSDGVVTVLAVSADPVTITAKIGEEVKETLTIDKTVRAPINIFLIVGQSNADGAYSTKISMDEVRKSSTRAPEGTTYCAEGLAKPYDLSIGRKGFASPLAARWYELTGEKCIMIQTAVSGTPIERWETKGDLYRATLAAHKKIKRQYTADDSNFEILRTAYFWCQGETGQMWTWKNGSWDQSGNNLMTEDVYYEKYMGMHEGFLTDMDVEFGSILLVRSIPQIASQQSLDTEYFTDLVAPRVAQYTIHNLGDPTVFISSRLGEVARSAAAPDKESFGYNLMFSDNVHYNQDGYNLAGKEMAEMTFAMINAAADRTAEKIDVLASDGYARLTSGDTVEVDVRSGYQLAAIVLPLYAKDSKLTYEVVENAENCFVNEFGKITFSQNARLGDTATVVIKNESGLSVTLTAKLANVSGVEFVRGKSVTYRWDFDNLKEFNEYNNLSLSVKSPENEYTFADGCLVLSGSNTDLQMERAFALADTQDWSIEWCGKADDSGYLMGGDADDNNAIHLAHKTVMHKNAFRMVDSRGNEALIPFGTYRNQVSKMNTWRVEYTAEDKTMTLYYFNASKDTFVKVGSCQWKNGFSLYITNLFGRSGNADKPLCYSGSIDYLVVDAILPEE